MIALKVDSQPLDMADDFSLTLKFTSPVFNSVGDHSYPFKIPATPRNQKILGWKHRVENAADAFREYDAALEVYGILIQTGSLKIRKASADTYEGTLYMSKGDFFYRLKKDTMQDIDFNAPFDFESEEDKIVYINYLADKTYPESPICFPQILNEKYFDDQPSDSRLNYMNWYDSGLIKSSYLVGGENTPSVIVPMLYLRYVLEKIFAGIGYEFDDQIFSTDEEFNTLGLFNLVDCNTDFLAAGYFSYPKKEILFNYHVPTMSLNDFLSGIENMFNVRFFVDMLLKKVTLKTVDSIIRSQEIVEFSSDVLSMSAEFETEFTGLTLKMNPDTDDLAYTELKTYYEAQKSHIKDPVDKVSDLNPFPASINADIRFVLEKRIYYMFYLNEWVQAAGIYGVASQVYELAFAGGSKKFDTKFSPLFMHDSGEPDDAAVVGCARSSWREVSPKLFFTRYINNGGSDKRLIARPVLTRNLLYYSNGLWFGNDDIGIFNKYFKSYYDLMIDSRLVKMTKQITYLELRSFDFSRKYMINGMKYLISEIQVQITNKGIRPATIVAYSCD